MTDQEQRENRRAIEHAIAQQSLEGLTMTSETITNLGRTANGEIPFSDVIGNLYARYAHVEILQL